MKLIKLMGATMTEGDNGEPVYKARGPVWVSPEAITVVYEHTVCTDQNKIRVMQTCDEIMQRIVKSRPGDECTAVVILDSDGNAAPAYEVCAEAIEERLDAIEKHLVALESMAGKMGKHREEAGA